MYGYKVLPYVGVGDGREGEDFVPVSLDLHGSGVCCGRCGGRGWVSGHACGKGVHGWCCLCNVCLAGALLRNVCHTLVIVLDRGEL